MWSITAPDFRARAQTLNNGLTTSLAWGSLISPRVQLKSVFYIVTWYNGFRFEMSV